MTMPRTCAFDLMEQCYAGRYTITIQTCRIATLKKCHNVKKNLKNKKN